MPSARRDRGEQGYGVVVKVLHWLTVVAIVAQFAIGWSMDAGAAADRAEERVDAFEDRREEQAEAGGEAAEERFEAEVERREELADALGQSPGSAELGDVLSGSVLDDGLTGVEAHVLVGLLLLALGVARLVWRRVTPLPPWAEYLSDRERSLESWLEKALLALLLAVPASGLVMVTVDGAELLALHIAAQVALLAAMTLHVGLVLRHTVVRRDGQLSRML